MMEQTPFAEYRKSTGKSPDEIAREFNVNRATIFRWEKGEPSIPVKRLPDAERITGIPRQKLRPDIFEGAQ